MKNKVHYLQTLPWFRKSSPPYSLSPSTLLKIIDQMLQKRITGPLGGDTSVYIPFSFDLTQFVFPKTFLRIPTTQKTGSDRFKIGLQ